MADKRDIQKRISSIRNRGAKMDRDIHETAVLCLTHARDHGDITLFTSLLNAMPNGSRREGMVVWARDHVACLSASYDKKAKEYRSKLKKGWSADDFQIDKAASVPFWEYTKERKPTQYDLSKAVQGFARTIRNARKQGNLSAGRDTVEKEIQEALNSLESEGVLS